MGSESLLTSSHRQNINSDILNCQQSLPVNKAMHIRTGKFTEVIWWSKVWVGYKSTLFWKGLKTYCLCKIVLKMYICITAEKRVWENETGKIWSMGKKDYILHQELLLILKIFQFHCYFWLCSQWWLSLHLPFTTIFLSPETGQETKEN